MLNQMSVKIRLLLLVSVPLLVLIAISLISVREMGVLSDGAESIYVDRVVPLKQIKQVADAFAVTSVDVLHKYRGEVMDAAEAVKTLQQQEQLVDEVWQSYLATRLTTDEAALAEKAKQQIQVFRQKLKEYQSHIVDGSLAKRSSKDFNAELYQLADPLSSSLAGLIDIQLVEAEKFKIQAAGNYKFFLQLFVVALLLVFACLAVLSWLIYRSIHNPLSQLQQAISVVGQDSDLRVRAQVTGSDEIATTAAAFNQTIGRVHQFFYRIRRCCVSVGSRIRTDESNQYSGQWHGF